MKIRIEFTNKEKWELARATECIIKNEKGETVIMNDKSKKVKGKFGTSEYNSEDRYFEFNFTEAFIMSIVSLVSGIMGLIKSLLVMFKGFEQLWFSDIEEVKDEEPEKETNPEDEKTVCPVRRVTDEEKESILGSSPFNRKSLDELLSFIGTDKEEE